jgi:replicative DNA helicase
VPNNLETFSAEFKRDCLAFLLRDQLAAKTVLANLPIDFFEYDPEYHVIFVAFREFMTKYKARPSRHELADYITDYATAQSIDPEEIKAVVKALEEVWDWDKFSPTYVKEKLYDAVTAHHVLQVARQIDQYVDDGDYDGLVKAMSDARFTGKEQTPFVEYWQDVPDRVERVRKNKVQHIPTGMALLDEQINGGLPRGSIAMLMGGSGFGKSALLGQFALNASLHGYTTAYLTLELSADSLMMRFDSSNSGIPLKDIPVANRNRLKKSLAEVYHAVKPKPAPFYVQYYPTKSISISHIEGFIQRLREERGITLDLLVVDYFDLLRMEGTYAKKYEALEENVEILRGLGGQYNMAIWTASQVNRSGIGKEDVDMEDIASGFGKVFPLDLMLGISATKQERIQKVMRLTTLKSRLGPVGEMLFVEPDFERMQFNVLTQAEAKAKGLYKAERKKGTKSSFMGKQGP